MEKRDLYDINRHLTGETIFKDEKIPKDRYILVVLVFIQNSKGEFLIQKRSIQKDGKYASTGGHPKTSENSIQGMITEIKEEIGLDVSPEELQLFYSDRDDIDQVFFDLYYMKKDFDIQGLVLQKEEVDFIEWDSLEKISELRSSGKFKKEHAEAFDRLLPLLNKQIHKMKLLERPFYNIKNGSKKVEFRLYDDKRKKLKVGDLIEFSKLPDLTETLKVEITNLYKASTFKELFEKLYTDKIEAQNKAERMYEIYSPEKEKEYGVLGIEIQLLS